MTKNPVKELLILDGMLHVVIEILAARTLVKTHAHSEARMR